MDTLAIRRIIADALFFTGLLHVFRRALRPSFRVLMYHRIVDRTVRDDGYIQPGMYVSADTFRRHLECLKKNYHPVSLEELLKRYQSGQARENYCALTFDDGWLDNYTQAFPLLVEYEIPATIFLATGFIGSRRSFWPEEVISSLECLRDGRDREHRGPMFERLLNDIGGVSGPPEEFYEKAISTVKKWKEQDRQALLAELRENDLSAETGRQMMNWQEAAEMKKSGLVTFGAHTVNHVLLDQVEEGFAEQEIAQSRNHMMEKLDEAPRYFAYPNGNFSPEVKRLVEKHGFEGAVTTRKGAFGKTEDVYEIPRIGVHEDITPTAAMLQARMLLKGL